MLRCGAAASNMGSQWGKVYMILLFWLKHSVVCKFGC